MRIGLVRMRHTKYGGAETFLSRFMAGLIERGHSIDLFTTGWEEMDGVTVHKVKARGLKFLRPKRFAQNAFRAIEEVKPDVVISLERTFYQDIYRAGDGCHSEWLARRGMHASGLKRIQIAANPLHMVLLDLEHQLFSSEKLKKVVANSEMVKADIIRHYGLPEEKICVIYNGVDTGAFVRGAPVERTRVRDSLGVPKDAVLLLFVGSGFERKGLSCLIKALGVLKDASDAKQDIRLVVVGKGRTARYASEAAKLGLSGRVIFAGPVAETLGYYQAADIFVLPSLYDPFSNACLEAMAAGVPVVTSASNGAAEIMTGALRESVVNDPTDPAELAEKLKPLLNAEARTTAGKASAEVAAGYTIEKTVGKFLDLIEELGALKEG